MGWSRHVPGVFQIEFGWSLISAKFDSVSYSGELIIEFHLWCFGRDQVASEATRSIGRTSPGTETRVVPSDTVLASLDSAVEFASELAESLTWRANCQCLAAKPAQGYP